MDCVRIGCSGFHYSSWRGPFYPHGMPQKKWFAYYGGVFTTVELNVTFYRLPPPSTFDTWYRETPSDFIFALKGSRFITHVKRLLEPAEQLERFFAAALRLQEKLHVVLWQFPPGFPANIERLERFLVQLAGYPVRNTLEFRNRSWIADDVMDLCRKYNVSLCSADWPDFLDMVPSTADFAYIRRHGRGGDYSSRYTAPELERDARRIRAYLQEGRQVFMYFNNDAFGNAPANALELIEILKKAWFPAH